MHHFGVGYPGDLALTVTMAKTLLLDGFNLAFRSYYALPDLTRSDGFPTGALHGWIKTLWKLEDMENPDRIIVFFDEGGSTRHQALLPEYKANRTEMPEALQQQMPLIRELTALMGYPIKAVNGIEADDLLASAAQQLAAKGDEVIIVSADKDLGQCVAPGISQLLPAPTANPRIGWRKLDRAAVEERFGVPPEQIADYLALVGDSSDNIPGLPGVGPKTAAKWLRAYGSLEGVLRHAAELQPVRFQAMVEEAQESLRRNLKLTTLELHHDPGPLEGKTPDLKALTTFLDSMEMKQSARDAVARVRLL